MAKKPKKFKWKLPSFMSSAMEVIQIARRAVPVVDFALGAAGVAAAAALVIGFIGFDTAALIIFSAMLLAMFMLIILTRLVTSKTNQTVMVGVVLMWGVALFFITFLIFTATAVAFKQPQIWAEILGFTTPGPVPPISPSVKKVKNVCLEPNVKIATNSCNQPDGTYIVVNVAWSDPTPGLRVRKTPGTDGELLGILPVNTTDVFVGSCLRKGIAMWCQLKCKGQNLEGWSNISYLAPVSGRRKDVVGVQDAGIGGGLPVLNGPSSTCSRTGFLPPDGKEVISHQCLPDEATNWWCLVTYKAISGWVIRDHLK